MSFERSKEKGCPERQLCQDYFVKIEDWFNFDWLSVDVDVKEKFTRYVRDEGDRVGTVPVVFNVYQVAFGHSCLSVADVCEDLVTTTVEFNAVSVPGFEGDFGFFANAQVVQTWKWAKLCIVSKA